MRALTIPQLYCEECLCRLVAIVPSKNDRRWRAVHYDYGTDPICQHVGKRWEFEPPVIEATESEELSP